MKNELEKKIAAENLRLLKLFSGCDETKLKLAKKEIETAAFLSIMLRELEHDIAVNGFEDTYQNGANQSGKKKSAAADLHVSYTKNFVTVMKQLYEILDYKQEEDDDLMNF